MHGQVMYILVTNTNMNKTQFSYWKGISHAFLLLQIYKYRL